jgi:hypothetical protein
MTVVRTVSRDSNAICKGRRKRLVHATGYNSRLIRPAACTDFVLRPSSAKGRELGGRTLRL